MSLFVSSPAVVLQPGVFLIEVAPPTIIDGVPNGYVGLVFQGEWGPVDTLYTPINAGDMMATFFPPGTPHNSTGYYAVMRRKQVPWSMCRILGGAAGIYATAAPTAVVNGTPGSTQYTYVVVPKNATGAGIGSPPVVVTTGNATIGGGNTITLTLPTVTGATSFDIYRTQSGGTPSSTGKIGNTSAATFTDTGLAGDSTLPPTVNGTGYAPCVMNLLDAAGNPVMQLVLKFPGAAPNGIATAQVAAAADGIANHFDLTLTWTNAVTGTTQEIYKGLQTQATAILPVTTNSLLLGSGALIGTPVTRPVNGTFTFIGGGNGLAVTANDYQTGLTQLATKQDIAVVCVDDCGDTIRAAVNANVQAHVDSLSNRSCVLQGSPLNALASVLTDVANYRDDRVIYSGAWVNVNDDSGNPQQSPFSTFIASARIQLRPQQSFAWWDPQATQFYTGIASLANTGTINTQDDTANGVRAQCTTGGVTLPIRLDDGRFAALSDRTASISTSGKQFDVTRKIKDYLARSIKAGVLSFGNGPNTLDQWRAFKVSLDDFLNRQQIAGVIAPNPTAAAGTAAFQTDIKTPNNPTTAGLGQFFININATTPAPMEKIFGQLNAGPQVQITFQ